MSLKVWKEKTLQKLLVVFSCYSSPWPRPCTTEVYEGTKTKPNAPPHMCSRSPRVYFKGVGDSPSRHPLHLPLISYTKKRLITKEDRTQVDFFCVPYTSKRDTITHPFSQVTTASTSVETLTLNMLAKSRQLNNGRSSSTARRMYPQPSGVGGPLARNEARVGGRCFFRFRGRPRFGRVSDSPDDSYAS